METRPSLVEDEDVYALTRKGETELRGAGTSLAPTELEILVLVDGHANVGRVVRSAAGIAPELVRATLGRLLASGHIAPARGVLWDTFDAKGAFTLAGHAGTLAAATPEAHSEADTTINWLRHQGYYVRIGRRAVSKRTPADGHKLTVLVVEDDPEVAKLLRTYLGLEGFGVRAAANREEVVAALRHAPPPDMVLLDVTLPDVDGFDVLASMRHYPALKAVPVVMLTATATREAVLKGLLAGADGYVTKPFEIDALMETARAVLGLGAPSGPGSEVKPDVFASMVEGTDAEYRARLHERVQHIQSLQQGLAAGTAAQAQLLELHRELHTIAGSADMFGLPAVAQAASAAENLLDHYRRDFVMPSADGWTQVHQMIEALKHALPPR